MTWIWRPPWRGRIGHGLTWALACLLLASPVCARNAHAPARPMLVTMGPAVHESGANVYHLRVAAAGAPLLVLLPNDAAEARLEVNGAVRRRFVADVPVDSGPFGHGAATFPLANLHPSDHVQLTIVGGTTEPHIVRDLTGSVTTFQAGLVSGAYYAILLTIVIFQLATFVVVRDISILWYIGFIMSMLGVFAAADDLFGIAGLASARLLLLFAISSSLLAAGFTCSYLRLRRSVPQILGGALIVSLLPGLITVLTHRFDALFFFVPEFLGILLLLRIAEKRWQLGFKPAVFVISGLSGIEIVFGLIIAFRIANIATGLLSHWGLGFATVFDALVFSIGMTVRARFTLTERERMEQQLHVAELAATLDPLTGLLNRRGLEAWVETSGTVGTLLFVDLDDFKGINDQGGHAAGDESLKIVSRILRHAVREGDVVARFGGDEFVVILTELQDQYVVVDIMRRICAAVASLRPLGSESALRIGASIGAARLDGRKPFADVLQDADAGAYLEKADHKARLRATTPPILAPPEPAPAPLPMPLIPAAQSSVSSA